MRQDKKEKSGKPGKEENTRQEGRAKQKNYFVRMISFSGFFLPVLMLAAAALIPLLVFRIQDSIRCGKVVLGELESVDIASFNTGYETDLYKRLLRFAEGREKGNSYYVAAQDKKPTAELSDFLLSDRGLYQNSFLVWIDNGAILEEVLNYNVRKWKQYVIYGDDFSAGVNFMLWYIELGDAGGPTLKLLLDAETGDIYGLSFRQTEEELAEGESFHSVLEESWTELAGIRDEAYDYEMSRLWYLMACRYGGLGDAAIEKILQDNYFPQISITEEFPEGENEIIYQEKKQRNAALLTELSDYEIREILYHLEQMSWEVSEDKKTHTYFFLYEPENGGIRYELPFTCRMDKIMRVLDIKKHLMLRLGELLLGFPDIYEWIPEFTDSDESP